MQESDAPRRHPDPFNDGLSLWLGADDFEKLLAHGSGGCFGIATGAVGEQSLELAALKERVFAGVRHREFKGVDQCVGGFVKHGLASLPCWHVSCQGGRFAVKRSGPSSRLSLAKDVIQSTKIKGSTTKGPGHDNTNCRTAADS